MLRVIFFLQKREISVFGLGLAWHIAVSLVADNYELTQAVFVEGWP
jgi:hypothetical protein